MSISASVFESRVEKAIVVMYDENANNSTSIQTFIYKIDFKNIVDDTKFKIPRKNNNTTLMFIFHFSKKIRCVA